MPRQLQMSYEQLGQIENDLAMIKPRLTGADAKGNPFVITADAAIQDAHNPKKASLQESGSRSDAGQAELAQCPRQAGMVDMKTGQLELGGGIDVFTATGYELHTNSASVNLKQSIDPWP